MKNISFVALSIMISILIIGCNGDSKEISSSKTENQNDNNEIDNKYIEYLKNYESEGENEIKITKIKNTNYWITSMHGAGTHQEYYWVLEENKLIPVYIFEYGGMNDEIEYEFLNIKNNKNQIGKSNWDDIESLKIRYIENN